MAIASDLVARETQGAIEHLDSARSKLTALLHGIDDRDLKFALREVLDRDIDDAYRKITYLRDIA